MLKRLFIFFVLLSFFCITMYSKDCFIIKTIENYDYSIIGIDQYQISNIDYQELIKNLNVEVVQENVVSDRLIIEGYVSSIDDYVVLNGRKVNIQLSVFDNNIILGVPLIKESF